MTGIISGHYKPNPGKSSNNISEEIKEFEHSKYNMTPTDDEWNKIMENREENKRKMEEKMESEWGEQ